MPGRRRPSCSGQRRLTPRAAADERPYAGPGMKLEQRVEADERSAAVIKTGAVGHLLQVGIYARTHGSIVVTKDSAMLRSEPETCGSAKVGSRDSSSADSKARMIESTRVGFV